MQQCRPHPKERRRKHQGKPRHDRRQQVHQDNQAWHPHLKGTGDETQWCHVFLLLGHERWVHAVGAGRGKQEGHHILHLEGAKTLQETTLRSQQRSLDFQ